MNYSKIIKEAWHITTETPKLKWLILVPTFMAVLIFALKVAWQGYMYAGRLGYIEDGFDLGTIQSVSNFISDHSLWDWGILFVIITLLFMFVIPGWIDSTLILGVDHKLKTPDKYLSIKQKMLKAFGYYFRMFELNAILGLFSIVSIALFTATVFRFFNSSLLAIFGVVLGVYTLIAIIVNILFSFAPYYVVVDDEGIGSALKKSAALVFLNLVPTMGVLAIMLLINFRVIINILVVLGVPLGIFAAITVFSNSAVTILSILFGVVMFGLAAYITSITTVFSNGLWLQTFETLKARQALLEDEEVPS